MANNLYEYYTQNGGQFNAWNSPTRIADAQKAGISNYTGSADQNNQLLAYLTSASSATTPQSTYVNNLAGNKPTYTGYESPTLPTYNGPAGQTPEQMAQSGANGTPTNQPASQSPTDKAFADYLTSLTGAQSISPEQQALQSQLNTQTTDAQLARERALNSGETMGFAGGEAQRVGRNNDITIAGTAAQLQARQAYDQSRSTTLTGVAKARYEYEQAKLQQAQSQNQPFTLQNGTTRYEYGPDGKPVAVATGGPVGVTKSGTLQYTPEDKTQDSQLLDASRGTDGFVDPTLYQRLYKAWIANGGLIQDFIKQFPPKDYVNPANTWLPTYLRPPAPAIKKTKAPSVRTL